VNNTMSCICGNCGMESREFHLG